MRRIRAGSFSTAIADWCNRAGDNAMAVARQTCQTMAERVIQRNPIDTGFSVAQWYAQLNAPGVGHFSDGGAAQAHAGQITAQLQAGDTFYFTNSADYIIYLEYGHSKQAPEGMVRLTVGEAPLIANAWIRELAT